MLNATRLYLGSFDAERDWCPEGHAVLPAIADRQGQNVVSEMDQLLALCCRSHDMLMTRSPFASCVREVLDQVGIRFNARPLPDFKSSTLSPFEAYRGQHSEQPCDLVPYAITRDVIALGQRLGMTTSFPEHKTVARLSSKIWSNQWVQSHHLLGQGESITSLEQLYQYAEHRDSFLLKDPYGVAGRGTVHITSTTLLRHIGRHLARQVDSGKTLSLLAQPLFTKRVDFSAHVHIHGQGRIEWLGWREMVNDGFAYGASKAPSPALESALDKARHHEIALSLASDLAKQGYWGPVCIDGMQCEDEGFIPVLEVNPRLSMGRLSLYLDRHFSSDMSVELAMIPVTTVPVGFIERVVPLLEDQGILATCEHAGILPLCSSTLLSSRGRFYFARVSRVDRPEERADIDRRLRDVLLACGGVL